MKRRLACLAALLVAAGACAARGVAWPTDPGTPWPDYQETFDEATASCRSVRALSAELVLEGRAGGTRLRGRIHGGFARPGKLRLEGIAPFGPPVFVLTALDGAATLFLPRERRVLTAPTAAVLEALVGLALDAPDLMALVTGCFVPDPVGHRAVRFPDGSATVAVGGGAVLYLRVERGRSRLGAGRRDGLMVEYDAWADGVPTRLRVVQSAPSTRSGPLVDLAVRLSQVLVNPPLGPEVFVAKVPDDARPLTLDEVRETGPLARPSGRP